MKSKHIKATPKRLLNTLEKMSNYYGAKYLIELINHPGQPIHATRLRDLFNSDFHSVLDTESRSALRKDSCLRRNDFFVPDLPYSVDPKWELPVEKADRRYIYQVKQRLLTVLDRIAEARECNDLGRLDDLYDERDKLTDWLKKVVNIHGRSKQMADRSAKDYQTVKKNIEKIVTQLEALDPALARYVIQHLRTGQKFEWVQEV